MRIICGIILTLLLSPSLTLADSLPQTASSMGRELDRQLSEHFGLGDGPSKGATLIITTPVNLSNLEDSCPLARQMQEELARWFVQSGYVVREVRKGRSLLLRPETGELLLTRSKNLAAADKARSAFTLVGTYSVTSRNVMFNIRLMQTGNNDVYAMSTAAVPITGELRPLLGGSSPAGGMLIEPSVYNRLP